MGQISVETRRLPGSALSENQQSTISCSSAPWAKAGGVRRPVTTAMQPYTRGLISWFFPHHVLRRRSARRRTMLP
jgi:hypothetical protein